MIDTIKKVKQDIESIESEIIKTKDVHNFLEEKLQQAKEFLDTLDVDSIVDAIEDIVPDISHAIEVGESLVAIAEEVMDVVKKL